MLPFFKVIEESRILPHYTLSHEPDVGFSADAAARYHCGLGVAVVTFGVGAFNLVNAIAGAYAERSPVFVIAAPRVRASAPAASFFIIRCVRWTRNWRCIVRSPVTRQC